MAQKRALTCGSFLGPNISLYLANLLGQHGELFGELSDALEADHDERHVRHDEAAVARRRTDLVHQLRQESVRP